ASTGMGLLTGTWLAIGAVLHAGAPGSRSAGLGLLLIASTGALLSVAAAALITKPLATLVLATTAARFACVGVYELSGRGAWQTATGVIGIVLTAIAWYAATALLLEDVAGRAVLPTLRPGSSRTTEQLFANDLGQLASEPGVRHPA
ncbi:MAG: hypothetical protein JO147_08985, partial [Actinobacteria bacterium]|nr:hypothetical protein [Actinomycetota bacterium]